VSLTQPGCELKTMLILSEFQIEFMLPGPTAMVALLHLHPSLLPRLRSGNELLVESLSVPFPPNTVIPSTDYIDSFGNRWRSLPRAPWTP
jgi:hypothetical protein